MSEKTVAAISSFVMRGAVGLRAITFALERRGVTVWAVPTVVMPWHPGLGRSTRTPADALPEQLAELSAHASRIDAVLTGYFASAAQVEAAARRQQPRRGSLGHNVPVRLARGGPITGRWSLAILWCK